MSLAERAAVRKAVDRRAGASGGAGKGGISSGGMASGGSGSSSGKGGSSKRGREQRWDEQHRRRRQRRIQQRGHELRRNEQCGLEQRGHEQRRNQRGAVCDAAHAVLSITTSQSYTGKANDCVFGGRADLVGRQRAAPAATRHARLPSAVFILQLWRQWCPASLTADYANVSLKSGANPGCDFSCNSAVARRRLR